MKILIEREEDVSAIERVVEAAFKDEVFSDHQEQFLVERIRNSPEYINSLSFVAVDDDNQIIGHLILSVMYVLRSTGVKEECLALAPVSVVPRCQNQGVGRKLIEHAIQQARLTNYPAIFVMGHPEYYPKFGFVKASDYHVQIPFDVPDELFMVLELKEQSLGKDVKKIIYSTAFD